MDLKDRRIGYEYSAANDAYEIAPIDEHGQFDWDSELCITAGPSEDDARRIVALWNSSIGMDTDLLDDIASGDMGESVAIESRYAKLCDQLVAVLKDARSSLACCYDVLDWPANGKSDQDESIRKIDAIIAKVEAK